jgi:hypothetical protein
MITRRDTLSQALEELETQALTDVSTIVVNRQWWEALSPREQDAYHGRAERVRVELRADDAISSHYVELRGGDPGSSLETEHPT